MKKYDLLNCHLYIQWVHDPQSAIERWNRRKTSMCTKESKTDWISVKDEKPFAEYGESESVLTVDTMGEMRVLYWDGGAWLFPNGNTVSTISQFPVTHWMALPEPPREDKE